MKIYICKVEYDYEGFNIVGIYHSLEKAIYEFELYLKHNERGDSHRIDEHTVLGQPCGDDTSFEHKVWEKKGRICM